MAHWFHRRQNPKSEGQIIGPDITQVPVINFREPDLEMLELFWQRFISEAHDPSVSQPDRNSMRSKFIRIGNQALVDMSGNNFFHYQIAGSKLGRGMKLSATEVSLSSNSNPGILNDAGVLSFVKNPQVNKLDVWISGLSADYGRADEMGRAATLGLFEKALPGSSVTSVDIL
jgi:hypothetical protein